jgi:type IV pilus assembly protein PilM
LRFGLFGKQSKPLIGVDISASAVKMLELSETGNGGRKVERYAIAPLPKEAVADGNIANAEAVEKAMQTAWKSLKSSTRNIAMALPASAVIAKKLIQPKDTSLEDIETIATEEAGQMAPFPMEEVTFDFQVLGPSERNPEEIEILVVVTKKDRVEERVAVAESVGLKTVVMDVDNYAALRAFEQIAFQLPHQGKNELIAIIDIGAGTTHINILHDNRPVFQREHPFGGQILTQEIVRRFEMQPEEAEDAKRKGLLPDTYDAEVLRPFMDTVAMEISRALQLFFSSTPYHRIDHILLAGGCASIPGLDELVYGKLQSSTLIANPFARMSVSSQVKPRQLSADAPSLFVACGLALRRFDPK